MTRRVIVDMCFTRRFVCILSVRGGRGGSLVGIEDSAHTVVHGMRKYALVAVIAHETALKWKRPH